MESMNAQSSMAHNARTMQTKRIKWKNINWIIAESYVNRLQVRIVKADKLIMSFWRGIGTILQSLTV